jgi:hypothetical protein
MICTYLDNPASETCIHINMPWTLRPQLHLLISYEKKLKNFHKAFEHCRESLNSVTHNKNVNYFVTVFFIGSAFMLNLFYLNPTCKRNNVIKPHFQSITMDMIEITQTEDMKHM